MTEITVNMHVCYEIDHRKKCTRKFSVAENNRTVILIFETTGQDCAVRMSNKKQ